MVVVASNSANSIDGVDLQRPQSMIGGRAADIRLQGMKTVAGDETVPLSEDAP